MRVKQVFARVVVFVFEHSGARMGMHVVVCVRVYARTGVCLGIFVYPYPLVHDARVRVVVCAL